MRDAQQKAMLQQNRMDNQTTERNIMEKRIEECDGIVHRLSEGLSKQESEMMSYEVKIQEKIAGAVRKQVKDEINQYKFDFYRSSLFN